MQWANTLDGRKKKQLNVFEWRKSRANRPDRSFSTEKKTFFPDVKNIEWQRLWPDIQSKVIDGNAFKETCDVVYMHSREPISSLGMTST